MITQRKGYNMRQGSKMVRPHNGMRNGISLVEMLIAIVLFGLITVIGYNYYKNYYDTTFAAKQARIYAIIDQATQLSNALDVYSIKMGYLPKDINAMVVERILLQKPDSQPSVTKTDGNASNFAQGWQLDNNVTLLTGKEGVVFTMSVDSNLSTTQDKIDYCNILNNTANSDNNLSATNTDIVFKATMKLGYEDYNTTMFCYKQGVDTNITMVFVKKFQ